METEDPIREDTKAEEDNAELVNAEDANGPRECEGPKPESPERVKTAAERKETKPLTTVKVQLKRKSYSLKEKMDIITLLKDGITQSEVAALLEISRDSIKTMWSNRGTIEEQFRKADPKFKRLRRAKYADVDRMLYDWIREQKTRNVPLDSSVLKEKAFDFATSLGLPKFIASNGWFEGFKRRFNIRFYKTASGCGHRNRSAFLPQGVRDWVDTKWPVIRARFRAEDIFSAHETALFYRMVPEESYGAADEYSGGHSALRKKDRVTVMVCANMDGSEKKRLLVIGKTATPRMFPTDHSKLPVDYRANRQAWMTADIYEQWLRDWNRELYSRNRKVLLLVDNCSEHIHVPELTNVKVELLPPNVTTVLQPMDQGVIESLKTHYRRLSLGKVLAGLESTGELVYVNLLDAVFLVKMAWDNVPSSTVANSFKRCRLCEGAQESEGCAESFARESDTLINDFFRIFSAEKPDGYTMESYVEVDADVCRQNMAEGGGGGGEEEEEEVEEVKGDVADRQVAQGQVLEKLRFLRSWIINDDLPDFLHEHVSALEKFALEEGIEKRVRQAAANY